MAKWAKAKNWLLSSYQTKQCCKFQAHIGHGQPKTNHFSIGHRWLESESDGNFFSSHF